MSRPKKLRKHKTKKDTGISIYAQYREGYNDCKKLYDNHIPDYTELYTFFIQHCVNKQKAKELATDLTTRLK